MRLAFRVAGDPAAPPIVLLHGLGDDARIWDATLPTLAETHLVYALDVRGHGDSPHPGEYSFQLMRDDVLDFLDSTGIDTCVLIGHSLGGMVGIVDGAHAIRPRWAVDSLGTALPDARRITLPDAGSDPRAVSQTPFIARSNFS